MESGNSPLCDRCDCAQVQDEVHALLMCRDVGLCASRAQVCPFVQSICWCFFSGAITQPVSAQAVSDFLLQYDNIIMFFVSELSLDLLLVGPVTGRQEDQSQADQPNKLAEGPPK